MRLQYAKLKVEYGWQRQNLNEVENLYFHHSHLRNMRPSAAEKAQSAHITLVPAYLSERSPIESMAVEVNSNIQPSTPSPLLQASKSLPLGSIGSLPPTSPPSQSQPEQCQNSDARPRPSSQPSSSVSYPAIQLELHPPSAQPATPVPAAPMSGPPSSISNSVTPTSTSTSVPTTTLTLATSTVPTLTYDSFWSTHATSTGKTRALYRTHTGFSASATPNGHVAMLTPGGHAAVMTAEGVYVGGGRGVIPRKEQRRGKNVDIFPTLELVRAYAVSEPLGDGPKTKSQSVAVGKDTASATQYSKTLALVYKRLPPEARFINLQ
ncbi:hypothetical protein BU15DRAFT_77923 [Melanogaster broomeanus]|nr:hypothetical protein BU15DRAFT_77923 [Melanogaster broomeanus]